MNGIRRYQGCRTEAEAKRLLKKHRRDGAVILTPESEEYRKLAGSFLREGEYKTVVAWTEEDW